LLVAEEEHRVVLRVTCERDGYRMELHLRADRWDQLNMAEPRLVCSACRGSFTIKAGDREYVGMLPPPTVEAVPALRAEAEGNWDCANCGQKWISRLEGAVADLAVAQRSLSTFVCDCGSPLVLSEWTFHQKAGGA
jgi:hypothetical protein